MGKMEPCGEVGLLMNLSGQNAGSEILKTLLTSKMQKTEPAEVSLLSDLEPRSRPDDQIVFQIELNPIKSEFMPRNENLIQHIPVTYLSSNNSNLTHSPTSALVEPITYFLSQDLMSDRGRYCALGGAEPQKIILMHEVDSTVSQMQFNTPEVKSCAVKESQTEFMKDEKLEDRKEPKGGKVEKKVSTTKKSLNKRKNSKLKTVGRALLKKLKKPLKEGKLEGEDKEKHKLFELTKLEDNVDQVAERLKTGCECSDSNCFDGLKPDDVFKHRLNIADLTKAEHDMYLMGVIMASVHNLEETCRHKERLRIRSCYAYQGKKVCLTAFLYLQHVTLYQMKRLRSHLKNHGVSPRIHGNRGRKPANTFSLEIYRWATNFVQKYTEEHCLKKVPHGVETKSKLRMTSYHLPPECTKRIVHREYKMYCENLKPSQKTMKYSTFTNFLKKQFPNVKFHKKEDKKAERAVSFKMENTEKWKEGERKPLEDQGVDKCIQVDKTLVYLPEKTQILINGERLEMYDESETASHVSAGSQNCEQFF